MHGAEVVCGAIDRLSARDSSGELCTTRCSDVRVARYDVGPVRRAFLMRGRPLAFALVLGFASHMAWSATFDAAMRLPEHYRLVPERSSVALSVQIIGHTHLRMRFRRIDAELDRPPGRADDPLVTVTIDAASVDANKPFATPIVKSRAVLDVEHYPSIRFSSTRFVRTANDTGFLTGNLTIRGATRPVTLFVTFERSDGHPVREDDSLTFAADGHFSRTAFGLSAWSSTVGDDIHMTIHAEFIPVR